MDIRQKFADALSQLINTPKSMDSDRSICNSLGEVARAYEMDLIYYFKFDDLDKKILTNGGLVLLDENGKVEECYEEGHPFLSALDSTTVTWWKDKNAKDGRKIDLSNCSERDHPREFISLAEAHSINSFVDFPCIHEGKVIGFIGLGSKTSAGKEDKVLVDSILFQILSNTILSLKNQNQEQIKQENKVLQLRSIIHEFPDGVWCLNITNPLDIFTTAKNILDEMCKARIRFTNKSFESIFNIENSERIVDQVFSNFVNIKDFFTEENSQKFLTQNFQLHWSCILNSDQENEMHLSNYIQGVFEDGAIKSFWIFSKDITEKVRQENQDQHIQKLESIGYMASGIAHDFNNVLSIIKTGARSIKKKVGEEDKVLQKVDIIERAIDRGKEMTGQILAFSKKDESHHAPIKVNKVINEFMKMIRTSVGSSYTVKFSNDGSMHSYFGDVGKFHQVLLNLVVNAKDSMKEGGEIKIETSVIPANKAPESKMRNTSSEYIVLKVIDQGCGIPKEIQSKIFEPFYTTKGDHGTGLGLSTIYKIVCDSGGTIEIESENDKGTTFILYFPVHFAEEVKEAA